ncbi:DUF555 domain-containing protein [Candidatus Halobonum tyrrellensis]|nr:DUF555 domain-containing protein [Candidatus Halobonum tyrrellensis]
MDRRVVVEAAVPVYDVETTDEAVRIAISKTGEMLNPDLNYIEINMAHRENEAGERVDPAFIAADEALVALELEMVVFNVERDEHAARIARKEIGQRLENIPLKVLRVEPVEEDGGEDDGASDDSTDGDDAPPDGEESSDGGTSDGESDDGEDDLLPEFEEMVGEDG